MNIVVCVERVPDTAEEELVVTAGGKVDVEDLSFVCNEADLYAVEEALQLKEKHGGEVTLVTIGPEESEEILRMELAKGADRAVHVVLDPEAALDASAVAATLAATIRGLPHDLILAGCCATDTNGTQVGGTLAQLLGIPHATYVTSLEAAGSKIQVGRELEGGLVERLEIDLPAVVLVQTGLNKPRYASIIGIRKAGSKEVREVELAGVEGDPAGQARTRIEKLSLPPKGKQAQLIGGSPDEAAASLAQILKGKGLV